MASAGTVNIPFFAAVIPKSIPTGVAKQTATGTDGQNSFLNVINEAINNGSTLKELEAKFKKTFGKETPVDLGSLLQVLEQLSEGKTDELLDNIPELENILNQILSLFTNNLPKPKKEDYEKDNSNELVLGNSLVFLQNVNVMTNTSEAEKAPSVNLNEKQATKLVKTLLTLYEKLSPKETNTQVTNKLELTLGKVAQFLQNNGDIAQTVISKMDNPKFEKELRSILNELKFLSSSKVSSSNGSNNLQDVKLEQLVAKTLNGVQHSETTVVKEQNFGTMDTMPVSKTEQFTIYVQRQSGLDQSTVQKQFMEQFEQMIKASSFLKKNGALELTLKLKPAHLGDMVLKITQQNGEMAVKISVASNAVKELLESSMHQLRHMFSPNQVLVEKQPDMLNQGMPTYFENQEQSKQQEQHEHATNQQDKQEKENLEEEEASFKDLLFQMQI